MKNNESIIIVRQYNGIGIDKFLNGYCMKEKVLLQKRFYNGRVVYRDGSKIVGLPTLKRQPPCRIEFSFDVPF